MKQTNADVPEDDSMVRLFREVYSFSNQTIEKDRRTRLQQKLKRAGLLGSSYARQVLTAIEPMAKPDLASEAYFDDSKAVKAVK